MPYKQNPAAQSRAPSASGQFADRFTYWNNYAQGLVTGKANSIAASAAVRAVVESYGEVQS